jgi:hypothetical protein
MFKKTLIGLFAVAAVSMLSPNVASARAGFGGFHGGGFHGGGFRGGGFGFGFWGPGYGYPFGYPFDYPYGYVGYDADGPNCYLVRRRVMTRHGWRLRRAQVCG